MKAMLTKKAVFVEERESILRVQVTSLIFRVVHHSLP